MYYVMKEDEHRKNRAKILKLPKGISEKDERENKIEFFDLNVELVEINGSGIDKMSDFIDKPVPFFTEKTAQLLIANDVNNVLYKPCCLVDAEQNVLGNCYMGLVDKIDCLDNEKSIKINDAYINIVIDSEKCGYYKVFRIEGIEENLVIVTEDIKNILEEECFGVDFVSVEQYRFSDKREKTDKTKKEKTDDKFERIKNIMIKKGRSNSDSFGSTT